MTRLLRRCFSGLCLLSLLACLGTAWLWWRSYRAADDIFLPVGEPRRYSVRSEGGRVTVYRPPPRGRVTAGRAAEWRALFTKYHLACMAGRPEAGRILVSDVEPQPSSDRAPAVGAWPENATGADVSGPLLDALDSDRTFPVAHWALTEKVDRRSLLSDPPAWPAEWVGPRPVRTDAAAYNGLVMRFPRGAPGPVQKLDPLGHNYYYWVDIDPAQRPAIHDYWHRRLRVPAWSLAYGWLVSATALPLPLLAGVRLRRAWQRRRRKRFGLCTRCGYDLTGNNSGRCSECGEWAAGQLDHTNGREVAT